MVWEKMIAWASFVAVLAALAVSGGCEAPKQKRVETLINDAVTVDRMAAAQADTDWRGAKQEFEAERVRQNGWQGWHPPFEPIGE